MKKNPVALAMAALISPLISPAAFAQSSVTLYGVVDMGYVWRGDNVDDRAKERNGIDSGVANGSRLGFKGSEDLGNGLKAGFVLEQGIRVADVGCGLGASTILMAQAFPNSQFFGFDYHKESIDAARERAARAGVTNATFQVASAKEYPGTYDLVCYFDCLHDMGDPVGAAKHTYDSLVAGGTWMLIEPNANDDIADNLNPVGRVYYSASTLLCTPGSLSQEVGTALGAQAGEARLREVAQKGGFSKFRRATETPFNIILEGRK